MEVNKTKDGSVYKFVHPDYSETAIKDVGGCSGLGQDASEKYSVFISCSYGCQMNCKFCMLHTKVCTYKRLEPWEVAKNAEQAMAFAIKDRPSLQEKKVKIAWMGMGEPLYNIGTVLFASPHLVETSFLNRHASGFDCVDIGTSFPKINGYEGVYHSLLDKVQRLLQESPFLKAKEDDLYNRKRPLVRLFASIGSLDDEKRRFLMGHGSFEQRLDALRGVWKVPNSLICHLLLLEDVNDSQGEIEHLMRFFEERPDLELRLLRYNQCSGSPYQESSKFDEVAERFLKELPRVKVQMSPGSEVMAACGQFLV